LERLCLLCRCCGLTVVVKPWITGPFALVRLRVPFAGSITGVRPHGSSHLGTAFALVATMAAQSSASAAGVELVLTPCVPGMKPEDCGAEIRTPNGSIELNIANTVITINGNGVASPPRSSPNSILSFASAGTTGSIGVGGGGGDGGGSTNGPP